MNNKLWDTVEEEVTKRMEVFFNLYDSIFENAKLLKEDITQVKPIISLDSRQFKSGDFDYLTDSMVGVKPGDKVRLFIECTVKQYEITPERFDSNKEHGRYYISPIGNCILEVDKVGIV